MCESNSNLPDLPSSEHLPAVDDNFPTPSQFTKKMGLHTVWSAQFVCLQRLTTSFCSFHAVLAAEDRPAGTHCSNTTALPLCWFFYFHRCMSPASGEAAEVVKSVLSSSSRLFDTVLRCRKWGIIRGRAATILRRKAFPASPGASIFIVRLLAARIFTAKLLAGEGGRGGAV